MYYIYGELVLIENFIINLVILFFTSKITKKKIYKVRLIIASILGSIYSLMQFEYTIFTINILKILLSLIIIVIVFYPFDFRAFINYTIVFYTISALLGGCVVATLYFLNYSEGMTFEIHGVTSFIIVMGILFGIVVVIKVKNLIVDNKLNNEDIIEMNININNKKVNIKGFRDTGCSLRDPLTGKPILIVSYLSILSVLPEEIIQYMDKYTHTFDTEIKDKIIDINILKRIHYIPYSTLQNNAQYLFCYLADSIEFITENNSLCVHKVYVGISKDVLCQNNEFQALINPKLLFI